MTSFFVKFKILLICLLLLAMGGGAVWVVLEQVAALLSDDDALARLDKRNSFVNSALYYMYKSESDGLQLVLGNKRYAAIYYGDLNAVYDSLDSLKMISADSLQYERIDSVAALFALKERALVSMAGNADIVAYNKQINDRIAESMPDSAALKRQLLASTREVVRRDTVITKRKNGNFFNRVKNVFKKTHSDSTIVVTASVDTDSTHLAVADSVGAVIANLQRDISDLQSGAVKHQRALWGEWARRNSEINSLIFRLIKDIESDEMGELLLEEAKKESENDTTVKMLAAIAIVAIFAVLFFIWVIWRDLERSNRYKKELERMNKANLDLLNARENLMLAITHDIKAPLGSIMGYTDLLARLAVDNRQKVYISSIKASSDLLLSLVTDLLEFYRLESDKEDLKIVPFNVAEFFDSVHATFLPMAEKKNLKLSLDMQIPDGLCVESDPIKLKQIVNNLINNAIKFTDEGSVGVCAVYTGDRLEIRVKDTGRGISEDEKERLFDAFVRLDSSRGVQGFGLGLSIVERTVALMGGVISVESEVGQGSCFTVSIPVAAVENAGGDAGESSVGEIPAAGGYRILLVDDDGLQMNLVCEICKGNGIAADKCQYPSYASKMVAEVHYDMVVTDIQMPEMSGFDVLSSIRAVDGDVPVVAVTARQVNRDEYLQAGFADVLTKPFKEADFIGMIGYHLDGPGMKSGGNAEEPEGLQAMLAFAGDDKEARNEILDSFISQTEENMKYMEMAYEDGDCQALMTLCHKMMPIFAMMGEDKIVFILKKYESGVTPSTMITSCEMDVLNSRIKEILDLAKKEKL